MVLSVVASALCGLVLLVSALSKVRGKTDYADFVATVPAFGIPARWTSFFAVATVVAEFGIALVLLGSVLAGRWFAVAGLVLAVGLFGVLTAAVWRAVARGSGAVCRCFGRTRTTLTRWHVVRNASLFGVAVLGLISAGVADVEAGPAAVSLAVVVGTVGAVLVVRFDDLADLVAGPA
ncbi:methylamine utilization protein MauE [Lentzea sp. BCCO 10_0856]|uniref:Methylamine utilization protein MauE n=1 Tax=Lentzea miocenica TaxID=3095431 RepID=A0ABU4T194_9PSEU|nr:MauE/DoxX family redox-associated membrane protein [Lentzea sp. BCCO 10_0856]MDX8031925.1 methylamine utilization protein MauE [Lentzea sp. BCCO 10_0856]